MIGGAGTVFIASGLLFMVVGGFMMRTTVYLYREGIRTEGTIVDVDTVTSHSSENGTRRSYSPIVEFTDRDGRTQQMMPSLHESTRPSIGTKTAIIYDPKQPGRGVIDSGYDMWQGPVMFILMPLVLVIVGFAVNKFVGNLIKLIPQTAGAGFVAPGQSAPAANAFMPNASTVFGAGAKLTEPVSPVAVPAAPPPLPPGLQDYVKATRAQGFDDATVRKTLIDGGWSADDVDRALKG